MNRHLPLAALFFLWPAAVLWAFSGIPLYGQTVVADFAVEAGAYARVNVPVRANLEGVSLQALAGEFQLFETTDGMDEPVASQLEPGRPHFLVWILAGDTPPGTVRRYQWRLLPTDSTTARPPSAVRVVDDGEGLAVQMGEAPVLTYRYAMQDVPEGVDPIYRRSGFIHPLRSPEGEVLSRIQPPDHYHHYGIWNPWTHTEFEGREVDFWNLHGRQGTVRASHLLERHAGDVAGGFRAALDHVVFYDSMRTEKVAMNEQWGVSVWNADPEQKTWLVDFTSTLSPASDAPLTILAYRYQGFSLRATERWNDTNATLLTSEGFNKSNGNATRARWLDVNGETDAESGTSGVLFLTHPGNYNYPEQLRLWPTGANGGTENVYINFNPAQDRDWKLEPGHTYALNYRMVLYDGTMTPAEAERHWHDFAYPPQVKVYPTGSLRGAKVLVYTKNGEGYVHDNIPHSIAAIEKLGETYGFGVDASDDPAVFTDANLAQYAALVFSNTNNQTFDTEAQRMALQIYVRNGGGVVGIHSASGSERDWPWFSQLMGGNFERHAPRQDFTAEVIDASHPSTAFLGATWDIEDDECYYLKALNPRIKVLLAADLTTVADEQGDEFPGTLFGDRFPIAWYQTFDGGRQWYTSLGHRPEHYVDPTFLKHILGGLQWAARSATP